MKRKFFASLIFLWFLAACAPTAVSPEPDIASRPTVIATALVEATGTAAAVPPTPEPQPSPTITPTPETAAYTPRFDRFLPFAENEGGSNSLTGLVRQGDGWQLERIPYPPGLFNEELGYALSTDSVNSDYAVATDHLLAWSFAGGAGPGNLAVGQLFIVDVATEAVELVSDNVVSAGWAPNGLDFAYVLATPETYELRWRTSTGEDRLLAVDVPHSLRVSPDGRYVAFTRESHYEVDGTPPGLYVVEVETGIETRVSSLDRAGYGGGGFFWKPHWTPDSSQLFLYAGYDDDRAPEPHPAGYVWSAVDGSFSHFLPDSAFLAHFDKPLREPENYHCFDMPPLFAANKVVVGIGECPPFGGVPEVSQPVTFALDAQTGAVELVNIVPSPESATLLTWDVPGESVLLLSGENIFTLGIYD